MIKGGVLEQRITRAMLGEEGFHVAAKAGVGPTSLIEESRAFFGAQVERGVEYVLEAGPAGAAVRLVRRH